MKKLVLWLLAVTDLACSASAQTEQGKFVLRGSFSFGSTKVDGAVKPEVSVNVETYAPRLGISIPF